MRYPLKDLQLPADKPDPKKLATLYTNRARDALDALSALLAERGDEGWATAVTGLRCDLVGMVLVSGLGVDPAAVGAEPSPSS